MEVRNEEMVPFWELSREQQAAILVAQTEGSLEYYHGLDREWYNAGRTLIGERGVYRTKPKEERQQMKEIQRCNENSFPWHMVSSEWNALAKDDGCQAWYLYKNRPPKCRDYWYGDLFIEVDEAVQKVIGVDMSQWNDIPWNESLMLRPGYEQQDIVETVMDETASDEEATVVTPSNTTKEYPVVKLKNLHKCSVGDIVRLKKTGELIEVGEDSETGCSGCKFSAYDAYQHPCRNCGFMEKAYVDYKQPTETQGETFANTEVKVYADLDDKTKKLLQVKQKEGKVQWLQRNTPPIIWIKKGDDLFFRNSVYRVV